MDDIYVTFIYIGLGLLLPLYYYYLTKNYGYWKKKCVPYIKGSLPGLGNMFPMFFLRMNMFQIYEEFYNKMPGCSMVGFYNGREPALLIRDPEVVKSVLITNQPSFNLNIAMLDPKVDRLLSRNPFFLSGHQWKSARQQLSSAYTSGRLKFMYESINTACVKLVKYLDDKIEKGNGELEVELKEMFSRYTAEAVASAAYGVEGNSFKNDADGTFVTAGKAIFEPSFTGAITQLVTIFTPFIARLFNAGIIPPRVDKLLRKLVKDMLKYRADHNIERNDFLQVMINFKKSRALDHTLGDEFDDDSITSHSASFFFEGYETSSITLSFAGYQLASHPEIQQRLRDEVLTVVEKHNGITYEALQEMKYMDQVLMESMRLYPPAGLLFKICTNTTELKGSDGITCEVTPGTPVIISLIGLQKDPEYWPDPEKFDPDRFSEENKNSRHKFTYLPFGEGPRACIGVRVAMLQIKAVIATMIKNYTLELSPKTQVPIKLNPYYFMASALGGLWAKLKPL